MPSVAYIQVLRAALELGSFTAKELADETALPLESIRTMLKRSPTKDLFEDIGEDERVATARRAGRPARRYRLRDPEAARREASAAGLSDVTVQRPTERPAAERASSVLDLALANLQAALTEDVAEESTAARIETARRTAALILEGDDDTPPEIRARAHEYIACGEIASGLLLSDDEHRIEALAAAAEHGAKAFELDAEIGRRVTRLLLAAAEKAGIDPPVAETATSVPHHDLFHGDVAEVELVGQTFRVPRYALALMRSRSPAGLVVRLSDIDTTATVERALEGVSSLNVPTYVALEYERDSDFTDAVQRLAVSAAAYWMPAGSLLLGLPTAWIANGFDRVVNLQADRVVLDAIHGLRDGSSRRFSPAPGAAVEVWSRAAARSGR